MRIVLLGAPGAGKGTQASFLHKALSIPKISTGDMLRTAIAENTSLGREAKAIMEAGRLVPDPLMIQLVKDRLSQPDCQNGFLLDGFPRTLAQAEALTQSGIHIEYIIEIQVDEAEIIHRMSGRRVHPSSGRTYHVDFHPPKTPGQDDITGEPLIQREDDREETVRHRLHVYQKDTRPLVRYYEQQAHAHDGTLHYIRIDGMAPVDTVKTAIFKALGQCTPHELCNAPKV